MVGLAALPLHSVISCTAVVARHLMKGLGLVCLVVSGFGVLCSPLHSIAWVGSFPSTKTTEPLSRIKALPLSTLSLVSLPLEFSNKVAPKRIKTMLSAKDTAAKSNNNKVIQWGIIGLGDVCTTKAGPAFYKSHGSTLSAVMRRTPGMAQSWIDANTKQNRFPDEIAHSMRAFESVDAMLSEVDLDALYVSTPPGAHLQVIHQIVAATTSSATKPKAVYVEKPCGRCAWETRAIIDELSQRNILFFPAYVSLAHERTQKLQELLQNQVCGDKITRIKYTQRGTSFARGLDGDGIPWRLDAKQSGGGLIMDMGCHILSRIDHLLGPIVDVKSIVLRKGGGDPSTAKTYPLVEDFVSMSATIGTRDWSTIQAEGAKVECIWDFAPPDKESDTVIDEDELVIEGSKGALLMAGMSPGMPIKVLDENGINVQTIEFEPPQHSAQRLIQSIVYELNGETDLKCSATASNAIRTSDVLDAILSSYYGGRHDEFWTRDESWPGLKASA